MPRPLFEIGEEVVYVGDQCPQFRFAVEDFFCCDNHNKIIPVGNYYYYGGHDRARLAWILESDLRKKPKPADQSFTELMDSLQEPLTA